MTAPPQLAALRAMRCRYVQGWLIGRPMPPADVPAFLDAFDPAGFDLPAADVDTPFHSVGHAG